MAKAKKQRDCPATGRRISRAECAENRISRYACPADCVHNPFAPSNYGDLLKLEEKVDNRILRAAMDTPETGAPQQLEALYRDKGSTEAMETFDIQDAVVRCAFRTPLGDGRTLGEQLLAETSGWKNDERVLLRAKAAARIMLLEVRGVAGEEATWVVDLLDGERETVELRDRSLSERVARFDCLLGWGFDLPHFRRLGGAVIQWPDLGNIDPVEALVAVARHLGGPGKPGEELREWLGAHLTEVSDALTETARERKRRMFADMDAITARAFYATEGGAPETDAVAAALDASGDCSAEPVDADEAEAGYARSWAWLCPAEETANALVPGRRVLGNVREGGGDWCVEAFSRANFERLKEAFAGAAGERVRFVSERVDDLARQRAGRGAQPDAALVVPELVEDVGAVAMSTTRLEDGPDDSPSVDSMEEALARRWLDQSVPALSGKTPREAAAIPEMREALTRLAKGFVQSQDRIALRKGGRPPMEWFFAELGLPGLAMDYDATGGGAGDPGPAPEASRPGNAGAGSGETGPDPVPIRAGRALDGDAIRARDRAIDAVVASEEDMREALPERADGLMDDLEEALEATFDPPDAVFEAFVNSALFGFDLLAGTDMRACIRVEPPLLIADLRSTLGEMVGLKDVGEADASDRLRAWMEAGRQPELVRYCLGYLLNKDIAETVRSRYTFEAMIWLRAAIDNVDARLTRFAADRSGD